MESTVNKHCNKKIQRQMKFKSTKKKNEAKTGNINRPPQKTHSSLQIGLTANCTLGKIMGEKSIKQISKFYLQIKDN